MRKRFSLALLAAAASHPAPAHAWGATGHEWISGAGADLLPPEAPAFLRAKAARATIAEYGREPDRSKGAGRAHDAERDPAHFVDLGDNGEVMGVLALAALPETRGQYDAALNAFGFDQYKAGYLPYSITDGYQQLVKDFSWWRASTFGARWGKTAADRAYFKGDAKRREQLTLRDLGVWSHYVGDASMPQHVSIHYDAWGQPNPNNYSEAKGFHARWEGVWVKANLNRAAVIAAVPPFRDCGCPVMKRAEDFIAASAKNVETVFKLEARGALKAPALDAGGEPIRATDTDPEAARLVTSWLASSAAEIRDLTILAWRASAAGVVGYPGVHVADIETGKIVLTKTMYAND
jgi:hypothetical protein